MGREGVFQAIKETAPLEAPDLEKALNNEMGMKENGDDREKVRRGFKDDILSYRSQVQTVRENLGLTGSLTPSREDGARQNVKELLNGFLNNVTNVTVTPVTPGRVGKPLTPRGQNPASLQKVLSSPSLSMTSSPDSEAKPKRKRNSKTQC